MEKLIARGSKVALPNGALPEVFSPYLDNLIMKTGGSTGPIGLQFVAQPELENRLSDKTNDPLNEDQHRVPGVPWVINKYGNRVLFELTNACAAYCRFCTRGREVGIPGNGSLTMDQVDKGFDYIIKTPEIREIIFSGGDPLLADADVLQHTLDRAGQMQKDDLLDFVRIGTRLPIHNPIAIKERHYTAVAQLLRPHLMVHINCPEELTPETINVIDQFRQKSGAIVMSQSVLLRGVNDDANVLVDLFRKIAKAGIVSYYLFQNDPVSWADSYTVPFSEAREIWEQVRPRISGIVGTAKFVIDVPGGYGKIPLPEGGAWDVDYEAGFRDFKGKRFSLLK